MTLHHTVVVLRRLSIVPSARSLADKAIQLELLLMVKEDGDAAVVIFPGDS